LPGTRGFGVFKALGMFIASVLIALSLQNDFLDRCRTTINVLGDVNVSCLLDGKVRPAGV
jgi:Na+/H+-dicarboxylate symporter